MNPVVKTPWLPVAKSRQDMKPKMDFMRVGMAGKTMSEKKLNILFVILNNRIYKNVARK